MCSLQISACAGSAGICRLIQRSRATQNRNTSQEGMPHCLFCQLVLGLKLLRSDVLVSVVAALAMALPAAAARVRVFVRTCVQSQAIKSHRGSQGHTLCIYNENYVHKGDFALIPFKNWAWRGRQSSITSQSSSSVVDPPPNR